MSRKIAIRVVAFLYVLLSIYEFAQPILINAQPFFVWLKEELFGGALIWLISWVIILFIAYRFWNMSGQDHSLLVRQKIALALGTINLIIFALNYPLTTQPGISGLEGVVGFALNMVLTLAVAALLLRK
ncbi:hypothetical protein C4587_02005 [Candidatus Parcubacteria bacterium]|nr:MAG: hypothetical protein C4587_02005 [Candidatus Parcubacteria bacterium]